LNKQAQCKAQIHYYHGFTGTELSQHIRPCLFADDTQYKRSIAGQPG